MTYESYIFLKVAQIFIACFAIISFVIIARFFYKIRKWDKEENNKSTFHFLNSIRHPKNKRSIKLE